MRESFGNKFSKLIKIKSLIYNIEVATSKRPSKLLSRSYVVAKLRAEAERASEFTPKFARNETRMDSRRLSNRFKHSNESKNVSKIHCQNLPWPTRDVSKLICVASSVLNKRHQLIRGILKLQNLNMNQSRWL